MEDPYDYSPGDIKPITPEQHARLERLVAELDEAQRELDQMPRERGNEARKDAQARVDLLMRGELPDYLIDDLSSLRAEGFELRIEVEPKVTFNPSRCEEAAKWMEKNGHSVEAALARRTSGDPVKMRGPLQRLVGERLRAGKDFPEKLLGVTSLARVVRLMRRT